MDEPTVEFLDDGRVLMVLRGSNHRRLELPSYRVGLGRIFLRWRTALD